MKFVPAGTGCELEGAAVITNWLAVVIWTVKEPRVPVPTAMPATLVTGAPPRVTVYVPSSEADQGSIGGAIS